MYDTCSALLYTRVQARWEASRREEKLARLFVLPDACDPRLLDCLKVSLGKTLIRLGRWLVGKTPARQVAGCAQSWPLASDL